VSVQVAKPYADAQGVIKSIEYRSSPAEPFAPLDIDGSEISHLVYADDLRTIPLHELKVKLDADALKPHYISHLKDLRLVMLVRDTVLRREIVLVEYALDALPDIIRISREKLQLTSHRDDLLIHLVVVPIAPLGKSVAVPAQRLSRLAEFLLHIRNNVRGASFPYRPATAAQMLEAGQPPEAAIYLKLHGDPSELVTGQAPAENVFEVWIHEKVWTAMQRDRGPSSMGLRFAAFTVTTASLILATAGAYISTGANKETGVHAESVVGRLLAYLERQSHLQEGVLLKTFGETGDLGHVMSHLQHAFRFVGNSSRVDEEILE